MGTNNRDKGKWRIFKNNTYDDYNLTEAQVKACVLLAEGKTPKTKIADDLGISRSTLYGWLNDDEFRELYREILDEIKDSYMPRLINLVEETMNEINPKHFKNERNKVQALEKMMKLMRLMNEDPTEIINQNMSGSIEAGVREDDIEEFLESEVGQKLIEEYFDQRK